MKKSLVVGCASALLWAAPALVRGDQHQTGKTMGGMMAMADLRPAPGSQVSGTVRFFQRGNRVTIVADVRGLQPNSTHGFHIHQNGECTPPDFTSAGDHFNPTNQPHAGPDSPQRHVGDLGNLETGASGRAYKRMTVENMTLGEGATSVMGKAVIVHANRDDLKSQPSGDAGDRIACAIITPMGGGSMAMRK